jgi:ATP-dependent DNA helicase RecG
MFESKSELLEKIQLGEDSLIELKAVRFKGAKLDAPSRNDLADELAAFANSAEGVVVLGVEDKTREIEGIPLDGLDAVEALVREVCRDSISPPLMAQIIRLTLPDSLGNAKAIIRVDIPRSLFVHESPGGYLYRLGSSKRKLSPDMLARLFQQRSQSRIIRFDEQPVPGTSPSTLSEPLARRFIGNHREDQAITFSKLDLVTLDDTGAWRATVGGILMATDHPEAWLSSAVIEAVSYASSHPDSNYQLDARTITGPLDGQIRDAVAFVQRNMRIGAVKTPARVDVPQYSLRAVFEAVVNAVAHRDYSIYGSKIRLFLFPDRLELYSPGALVNTLSVDSLVLRQATRNELITSLLAKCPWDVATDVGRNRIMDKRGEGVPIIFDESERLSGRTPTYRLIDDSELLLTIFAANPHAGNEAP